MVVAHWTFDFMLFQVGLGTDHLVWNMWYE